MKECYYCVDAKGNIVIADKAAFANKQMAARSYNCILAFDSMTQMKNWFDLFSASFKELRQNQNVKNNY